MSFQKLSELHNLKLLETTSSSKVSDYSFLYVWSLKDLQAIRDVASRKILRKW